MNHRTLDAGREFVAGMDHGADWRGEIEDLAADAGVDAGVFLGLGAVQDAELYFYDQNEKEYDAIEFDEPLEVAACIGNVSWLDGDRFAHTHAVCSREDGSTIAGHLNAGTVFAGELYLREFDAHLEREHNGATELDLWPL